MATMSVVPEAMMRRPAVFDSEAAWQQVLARDASANGHFVYGVQSTGIYCRPGCPSRRPARNNVRFFATCEEAEASGFRACLRCEPRRRSAREDPHAGAVTRAAEMLREQAGESISLDALAQSVGLSRFALLRGFQRVLGITPSEFVRAQRRERFRKEVRRSSASVTDAVYAAGFGSSSRLYENAANALGMRPSTMKAHGAGETIRWSTTESPLGRILVAATGRGLCAVLFANSDKEAERELESLFAKAKLQRDDAGLGEAVRVVLSQMTESATAASLPFDVRATSFQHRVWEALRTIPRGETRTYSQIAQTIGSPKALRAVGAACGANPLAIVVPCHRAIGSDGRLTGYRWGVERKRQLLEIERGRA
ncbi:MAG TPA: bifunctional DNA-binding transcriptional regulator/O6-methylguanine-DNA methyltransferase Ada [Acidobacteriaceae bacterium]|nr:bifunctional DNA-binding transcriptional regulator/O6-methylguanine-DNA methyltransferase Ada [Acidobacteriaceae bacterium]